MHNLHALDQSIFCIHIIYIYILTGNLTESDQVHCLTDEAQPPFFNRNDACDICHLSRSWSAGVNPTPSNPFKKTSCLIYNADISIIHETTRSIPPPVVVFPHQTFPVTTRRRQRAATEVSSHILPLSSISSTAAPPMASLPVSLTFVWKRTLLPSRHISVTRVWPGSTVPAKRTLMFLNGPNVS